MFKLHSFIHSLSIPPRHTYWNSCLTVCWQCTCGSVHMEARSWCQICSSTDSSLPCFLRQRLSLNLELIDWLMLGTSFIRESHCLLDKVEPQLSAFSFLLWCWWWLLPVVAWRIDGTGFCKGTRMFSTPLDLTPTGGLLLPLNIYPPSLLLHSSLAVFSSP